MTRESTGRPILSGPLGEVGGSVRPDVSERKPIAQERRIGLSAALGAQHLDEPGRGSEAVFDPVGQEGKRNPAIDAELGVAVRQMRLDRRFGHGQVPPDLGIG